MATDDRDRVVRDITDRILRNLTQAMTRRTVEQQNGLVESAAERSGIGPAAQPVPGDLAAYIDHTLLKPDASESQIRRLCDEAAQFHFATVCVNPTWVRMCARLLEGSGVGVCTVAGFPLGATPADVKAYEALRAVFDGACEVDMVINVGLLKSGHDTMVREDIRRVAGPVHEEGARLKVIIETALLTEEEKVKACLLAAEADADYVKTSTGFGPGGAAAQDVALMRSVVGNGVGVKAAGGIRDLATVRQMIAAGATRIGASAGVKIVQEAALERTTPG